MKLDSVVVLNLNCEMGLALMRLDLLRNEITQERSLRVSDLARTQLES